MKLIECVVLIVSLSLFGFVSTAMIIPAAEKASRIKKMETKLERDKFIMNSINEVLQSGNSSQKRMNETTLINTCSKVWNLDSFLITEMKGYYKAEWSFNDEVTTYLIKKESK